MRKFKEKLTIRTSSQEITQEYKLSFRSWMFLCKTKIHGCQRHPEFGPYTLQESGLLGSFWLHVPLFLLHHSINIFPQRKKKKKKEIKPCWSALFNLYVSCFSWIILVPYKTYHWISMPVKVPCPNSPHVHIQRAGNPHTTPPNSYRDTKKNKIIFCILHSWE